MAFNGTGLFTRIYQWANDAALGFNVDATRTDTDSNDIAAGLSNCVTRDGQSPWLSNLPAGGMKITGMGVGNVATDSVNYGQVFNSPAFITPSITANPAANDNTLLIPSTSWVNQIAFQNALPAQLLGLLISNGTASNFSVTFTGFAVNEVKGADIASAATLNLTTATGNLVHVSGSVGITAITIPSGASRTVVFDGSPTLTNSANLILPGGINLSMNPGDVIYVRGDGAAARIVVLTQPLGDHEVSVSTGNGVGSTNTAIRRLTTVVNTIGTAITYADSATLGTSFTINQPGLYAIAYTDTSGVSGAQIGISINSAQLTTGILSLNSANIVSITESASSTVTYCGRVLKLAAGDVIRPHATPGANYTDTVQKNRFSIRKVGPAV